jgi:hypothetical protein
MRGAIFSLPNTPSWRGAQLKHSDKFAFFTICETDMDAVRISEMEKKLAQLNLSS